MFAQNKYFIFNVPDYVYPGLQTRQTTPGKSSAEDLKNCETQLAQAKESFMRASADFENYKRRMQREQAQWLDVGATRVLTHILPIVDDFDRALRYNSGQARAAGLKDEGFELIHKSLQKMLESLDVKEISADVPFDPELHEALVSVEDSGRNSGDVVEILQKGYTFKGKVLRPAKVSVAK